MSYCVHCGVELAPSEITCPLCGIESIDPLAVLNTEYVPLFPEREDIKTKKVNNTFIALLSGLLLWIPVLVAILLDALITRSLDWSLVVAGSACFIWTIIAFPFVMPKQHVPLYILVDYVIAILLVLLIALIYDGMNWFLKFALPFGAVLYFLSILVFVIFHSKSIRRLTKTGYLFLVISVIPLSVELFLNLMLKATPLINWSLYAFIPLLALSLFFLLIAKSQYLVEYIQRRIFV